MILAGDIGGTKVNFGLFDQVAGELKLEQATGYLVSDFASFDDALNAFLKDCGTRPDKICLGAAGPVIGGHCKLTNLSWEIEKSSLESQFGFSEVMLVNDLAATAASVPFLKKADLLVLQQGDQNSRGRMAVLSVGTGLGQACLIPQMDGTFEVLDTEGGQCGYAPVSPDDHELCSSVINDVRPLSIEDILSGQGLQRIYHHLGKSERLSKGIEGAVQASKELTTSEIIEKGCLGGDDIFCRTVDRFVSILGSVAGDMTLQFLSRGGVYIGGGIPPKIKERMQQPHFLESFHNKRKFRDLMKSIPVFLVVNEQAPLWGAASLLVDHRVHLPVN